MEFIVEFAKNGVFKNQSEFLTNLKIAYSAYEK